MHGEQASRRAQRPRPRRLLLPTAGRTLAARRRRLAFADNDDTTLAADCQAHRPATAPSASRLSRSSCCRRRLAAHWPVGPSRLQARAMPIGVWPDAGARCNRFWPPDSPDWIHEVPGALLLPTAPPVGCRNPLPPGASQDSSPGQVEIRKSITFFWYKISGVRRRHMRRPKPSSARVFSELVGHLSLYFSKWH